MYLRLPFHQNPIARSEYSFLERTTRSVLHWRYMPLQLLLAVGGMAAAWPLFFSITQQHTRLLASLGVIVFTVHFIILARTLVMGTNAIVREHDTGHWDELVLTGIDARRIVYGKWWSVFRRVWIWHVAVGVMNVGLALGIAQHIQDAFVQRNCGSALKMLCYNELYHYNYIEALNPAFKKGIVALFVTGIFGLLEAGLVVMLGILGASLIIRFKTLRYGLGFILWGIMVGLVLAIVIRVDRFALHILELEYEYLRPSTLRDWFNWIDRRHSAHILRMISLGIFSLGDGGTLISTNILRPYTPSAFNVLRNLVSAILGYWIYVFMMWGGLRLAQVMCVRNGASAPVKQPFMVRRLWRFFKNPVLKSQQHYIHYQHRQQKRWVRLGAVVLIALVFSGLLLVSAMPKWIYMDYTQKRLLYGMAGVLYTVHAIVGLRTLVVAGRSVSREFSTGTWDLLALTNVDARRLILSKWWATVRGVWFYHVLAGVLKVGLACGIAQFLHSELRPWSVEPSVQQAFNYISYNQPYDYFPINPNWHAVLRAGVILVLFGLVEAGLLAAIGLLSSLLLRKIGGVQLMVGIGLRVLPILATLLLVNKVSEYTYGYARYRWYMDSPNAYITTNESINRTILFESAQVVGTTQIDGGVLASTNLLRVQPMRHYFLVRAFVNIGIGMGIHIVMTIGVLWLTQKQAIRRGLSPPQRPTQGTVLSFKRLGLRV